MNHKIITTVRTPTGDVAGELSITAEASLELDVPLVAETEAEIIVPITLAQLKAITFLSDKDTVLKTNSSGAPDDTINLLAGVPLAWGTGGYAACPLTGDVQSIFATAATAATLQIRALYDPTA